MPYTHHRAVVVCLRPRNRSSKGTYSPGTPCVRQGCLWVDPGMRFALASY